MRNLRSVDLNLLVALDALLSERQVTRAANRIGLSQPAMSNALNRLRALFDDELLFRTTSGMEPTTRGLELAGPTQQILRQIGRVFESEASFDPQQSTRCFSVRMSDLLEVLLLPGLLRRLYRQAPIASLDLVHLSPEQTADALEADTLDTAVSTGLVHSSSIRAQPLFEDQMVCVMRKDHPAAGPRRWSLKNFLAQRHVRVSISPTDMRFVDNVLTGMDLRRDIALNTQHWVVLPLVLHNSDLIAVMSERLAQTFPTGSLEIRDLPLPSSAIVWSLYWHRRYDRSHWHVWLRQLLTEAAAMIGDHNLSMTTFALAIDPAPPNRRRTKKP
jgi:DNA-binding transcriptional LysR family regulator